jgi:hypothetical protein
MRAARVRRAFASARASTCPHAAVDGIACLGIDPTRTGERRAAAGILRRATVSERALTGRELRARGRRSSARGGRASLARHASRCGSATFATGRAGLARYIRPASSAVSTVCASSRGAASARATGRASCAGFPTRCSAGSAAASAAATTGLGDCLVARATAVCGQTDKSTHDQEGTKAAHARFS